MTSRDAGAAVQAGAAGRDPRSALEEANLAQGLLSWQHPDAELPPVAVDAMKSDRGGQAFLAHRQAAWQVGYSPLPLANATARWELLASCCPRIEGAVASVGMIGLPIGPPCPRENSAKRENSLQI